ncbi:MAG TPA: enoyl-CoA hydratase-related protein [Nitriliruptorales bacterium]
MERDVRLEIDGGVAVVTLDRPEVLNAVRARTLDELFSILDRVEADPDIRALVITGAGRAFSAGQDLDELGEALLGEVDPDAGRASLARLQELTRRLVALDVPTLAALNGIAVGLGAELALACDVRLACASASIGFVEVQRALFETNGVMYLLPRIVGLGRAAELLLTGDRIDADEAGRIGLVNHVVPDDELLDRALVLARRWARNAPLSIRLVKQVLRRTWESDLEGVMKLEVDGMLDCLGTEDLREGVAAFHEGREPRFRGR